VSARLITNRQTSVTNEFMRESRSCNSPCANQTYGGNALPCNSVDVGMSISLMNCKLTDFSALSLKLLLLVYLFITKWYEWRGK